MLIDPLTEVIEAVVDPPKVFAVVVHRLRLQPSKRVVVPVEAVCGPQDDDFDDFDDDDDDDDATCGPGVPRIDPASPINTLTTASHLPRLQL